MNNPYPQWFSDVELATANENYLQSQEDHDGSNHKPVIKLFTPDAQATWLISEVSPDDQDYSFGLCDLGMGQPELGYVLLSEIASTRGGFNLPVERDLHFVAKGTIEAYAKAARNNQRIVENIDDGEL